MRSIVVDAGPLIALFDRDDRYHDKAKSFLQFAGDARLITTSIVVGEVAAMLSDHPADLYRFLEWLVSSVEIDDALQGDLPKILEVIRKYSDLPADLADASLVVLCERRAIKVVASINSDFYVFRLPKGIKFENAFLGNPKE